MPEFSRVLKSASEVAAIDGKERHSGEDSLLLPAKASLTKPKPRSMATLVMGLPVEVDADHPMGGGGASPPKPPGCECISCPFHQQGELSMRAKTKAGPIRANSGQFGPNGPSHGSEGLRSSERLGQKRPIEANLGQYSPDVR